MARNEWSRWGRGGCVGHSLEIGSADPACFHASVSRGVRGDDGSYPWDSSINGRCREIHKSVEEAMARVEHELSVAGEAFIASYAEYKTKRLKNKYSQAVDAMRRARLSDPVESDGAP